MQVLQDETAAYKQEQSYENWITSAESDHGNSDLKKNKSLIFLLNQ